VKNSKNLSFAKCWHSAKLGTAWLWFPALPSASHQALDKEIFKKINKYSLLRASLEGTRQSFFFKKKQINNLCREPARKTLGKEFFKKKINNLCRAPARVALGKEPSSNASRETAVSLCRVLTWLSAKPLPKACHMALGKDCLCRLRLCRAVFAEWALGKGFAERLRALCRALRLSAKYQNPVVPVTKTLMLGK